MEYKKLHFTLLNKLFQLASNATYAQSRDSAIGVATGYGLNDRGSEFESRQGQEFYFFMSSRPALGPTQPPIQWVPGALSPGVKRPGREADHSPPTNAEVKKMWFYISLHGIVLNWLCTGTTSPYLTMRGG
jgi:hypothetical protein